MTCQESSLCLPFLSPFYFPWQKWTSIHLRFIRQEAEGTGPSLTSELETVESLGHLQVDLIITFRKNNLQSSLFGLVMHQWSSLKEKLLKISKMYLEISQNLIFPLLFNWRLTEVGFCSTCCTDQNKRNCFITVCYLYRLHFTNFS